MTQHTHHPAPSATAEITNPAIGLMEKFAGYCLIAAAAAVPFSTSGTNIAALSVILLWALSGSWRQSYARIRSNSAVLASLGLAALVLIGLLWTPTVTPETWHAAARYRVFILLPIAFYLCRDAALRRKVLWAFFISSALLLIISYAIYFGLYDPLRSAKHMTNTGAALLKNYITHGFVMSLLAYFSAVLAFEAQGWKRLGFIVLGILAIANVILMVPGRTGYLVLIVLIVWLVTTHLPWRRALIGFVLLTFAVGALYLQTPSFRKRIDKAVAEATDYERSQTPNAPTSVGLRLHFWQHSLHLISQAPLLGHGTGAWSASYYQDTAGEPPYLHSLEHKHPHNEYFMIGVQFGLLGLALFASLFIATAVRSRQLPRPESLLLQGLILAFIVGCSFNDLFWDMTEGHIWALLAGALLGALPQRVAISDTTIAKSRFVNKIVYLSHGGQKYHDQTRYSALTLLDLLLKQDRRDVEIVIYSDDPTQCPVHPQIRAIEVNPEELRRFRGPLEYVHRIKLCVLRRATQEIGLPFIYVDCDTRWLNIPDAAFTALAEAPAARAEGAKPAFFMHKFEGNIDTNFFPGYWELLQAQRSLLSAWQLNPSPPWPMWNAGTIGVPLGAEGFFDEVLTINDRRLPMVKPRNWMEQVALSLVVTHRYRVQDLEDCLAHYWNYGSEIPIVLRRFFTALPENLSTAAVADLCGKFHFDEAELKAVQAMPVNRRRRWRARIKNSLQKRKINLIISLINWRNIFLKRLGS